MHDPFFEGRTIKKVQFVLSIQECLQKADALVILVHHSLYDTLEPNDLFSLMRGNNIFDATGDMNTTPLKKRGFNVQVLGTSGADSQ